MSASFSAYPLNYTRFLELTRSTSRSLSPESELRQMTARRTYVLAESDSAQDDEERRREAGEAGAGATASGLVTQRGGVNAQVPHVSGVGDKQPARLASHAFTPADQRASANMSSEQRDDEQLPAVTTGLHTTRQGASVSTASRSGRRAAYTAAVLPCAWHYGSPLYYPVTGLFYCWNGHPLYRKPRRAYVGVEGVSCDFCGYTHWQLGETATSGALASGSDAAEADSVVFFHCEQCGVDLCPQCLMEVRVDERYHVPCMQCLRCKAFVPLHDTAMHSCSHRVRGTPPAPSTSTPAPDYPTPRAEGEGKSNGETVARRPDTSSLDMHSADSAAERRGAAKGRGRGRQRGGIATRSRTAGSATREVMTARGIATKRARPSPHGPAGDWEVALTAGAELSHGTAAIEQLAAELAVRVTFALTAEGEGEVGLCRLPTRLAAEKLAARAQGAGLTATVRLLRPR